MSPYKNFIKSYYLTPADLLNESVEQLALVLLEILKKYFQLGQSLTLGLLHEDLENVGYNFNHSGLMDQLHQWERHSIREKILMQYQRAWEWLGNNCLTEPVLGINGQNGYVMVTELGMKTDTNQQYLLKSLSLFNKDLIHPSFHDLEIDFRNGRYGQVIIGVFRIMEGLAREITNSDKKVPPKTVFSLIFKETSVIHRYADKHSDREKEITSFYNLYRGEAAHGNSDLHTAKEASLILIHGSTIIDYLDQCRQQAKASKA